ncbi:hypothetical protein J6590_073640 [Homalodisca vitripennis]|nr:hypothetical protein J6590_073640 [Homalodisca vitripennis]
MRCVIHVHHYCAAPGTHIDVICVLRHDTEQDGTLTCNKRHIMASHLLLEQLRQLQQTAVRGSEPFYKPHRGICLLSHDTEQDGTLTCNKRHIMASHLLLEQLRQLQQTAVRGSEPFYKPHRGICLLSHDTEQDGTLTCNKRHIMASHLLLEQLRQLQQTAVRGSEPFYKPHRGICLLSHDTEQDGTLTCNKRHIMASHLLLEQLRQLQQTAVRGSEPFYKPHRGICLLRHDTEQDSTLPCNT